MRNEYIILKSNNVNERITESPNFEEVSFSSDLISVSSATSLAYFLKREKIDLFHATSEIAPLWLPCKLVITVHDMINMSSSLAFKHQTFWLACFLRLYFRIVGTRSIKMASEIIAISKNTQKDILAYFPEAKSKVRVVYEAVEDHFALVKGVNALAMVKKKYCLPDQFIFYIGSTKENKNLFGLLAGFSRLLELDFPLSKTICLLIAGFKHFRTQRINGEIDRLGLTGRVKFAGFIAEDDLPAVYSAARLFAYPSLHEGFGLPLLEAMACETPIVTSTLTSVPEVVGDAAILCDPRNPENLAVAMRQGLEDERLRKELIRKGRARLSLFSWIDTARKTLDVYHNVLAQP